MRIGEMAVRLGVTADTVRFYERAGWLPAPERRDNGYRDYRSEDVEHLRLLIDLRRMDLPLDEAAQLASWCHAGHCDETSTSLPSALARRRAAVNTRIERLRELDERLAELQGHLVAEGGLRMIGESAPCCSAAAAVFDAVEGECRCCATGSTAGTTPP